MYKKVGLDPPKKTKKPGPPPIIQFSLPVRKKPGSPPIIACRGGDLAVSSEDELEITKIVPKKISKQVLPEVPDTALVLPVPGEQRRSQRLTKNKTPVDTSSLFVKAEDLQKVNGLKKVFQRNLDKNQIQNMKTENFVGAFSCYDVLPFCKTGLFLFCYTFATPLLNFCYTFAALLLHFCYTFTTLPGLFLKDHALYIMAKSIIAMFSPESYRVHFVDPAVVMSLVNLKTMQPRPDEVANYKDKTKSVPRWADYIREGTKVMIPINFPYHEHWIVVVFWKDEKDQILVRVWDSLHEEYKKYVHFSYTFATLLLHFCYTFATLCYTFAAPLLHFYYTSTTGITTKSRPLCTRSVFSWVVWRDHRLNQLPMRNLYL